MGVDNPQALVVENRGRGKSRGPKGRGNSKERSKSREKETRTCHYCKKSGHLKKYCYKWKRDRGKMQNSQKKGVLHELPSW